MLEWDSKYLLNFVFVDFEIGSFLCETYNRMDKEFADMDIDV